MAVFALTHIPGGMVFLVDVNVYRLDSFVNVGILHCIAYVCVYMFRYAQVQVQVQMCVCTCVYMCAFKYMHTHICLFGLF